MNIAMKLTSAVVFASVLTLPALGKQRIDKFEDLAAHLRARSGFEERAKHVRFEMDGGDEWKNPILGFEHLSKAQKLEPRTEYALTLSQPVEWGGKMAARHNLRMSEAKSLELESEELLRERLYQALMLTEASRQKQKMNHLYKEAIESFRQIVIRLNKLPSISNERKIEKEVLELAIEDYGIKHDRLESDLYELKIRLVALMGAEHEVDPKVLSEFYQREATKKLIDDSLELRKLSGLIGVQKAELKMAKAEAWPDFEIGASASFLKENDVSDRRYGLMLTFELPLWNQGRRRISSVSSELAYLKKEQEFKRTLLQNEFEALKRRLMILERTVNNHKLASSLEKKHQRAEELFKKGVISTGLIIEVHRQLIELNSSKSEAQMEYLFTLWKAFSLSGNINIQMD